MRGILCCISSDNTFRGGIVRSDRGNKRFLAFSPELEAVFGAHAVEHVRVDVQNAFDHVRKRIDGGVHDQLLFGRGEILSVNEGEHWENPVRDALLEIDFVVRDDRDRGRFGACSASGRHSDNGRVVQRMARRFVQFIGVHAWIHEEDCHGFCGIDSGTSPNADDEFGAEFSGDLCPLPHRIGGRVFFDFIKNLVGDSPSVQDFGHVVQGAVHFGGAVSGNDECALPDGEQFFRVIFHAFLFNVNVRRYVKSHDVSLQHQPFFVEPVVKSPLFIAVLDEPLRKCRAVNGFTDGIDKCFHETFADKSLIKSLDRVFDFVGEGDKLDCFFEDVD